MNLEKITSEIYNNIVSGLSGVTTNQRFTIEQIEDSVINERLAIIKEYMVKNIIPEKDLMLTIRCLEVDCDNISQCCGREFGVRTQHFEIPQIFNDYGDGVIDFIASTDNEISITVYTDNGYKNHKYRRSSGDKPYAWVDTTPNNNGFYDVFLFNAPFMKLVSVRAIFKDPRQLAKYECCNKDEWDNFSFVERDVVKRVTENYLRYYRQFATPITPNNQQAK
jgi:hypothetical protein